ncbi:MAG TPA: hypothetical protein V6C81_26720 [Planktothrix sp.]
MATEDEGNGSASIPDSSGKSSEDSSVSARRERTARLRGSLAKQVSAPDPYVPDPYMPASPTAGDPASEPPIMAAAAPVHTPEPIAVPSTPSLQSAMQSISTGQNAPPPAPHWTLELPVMGEEETTQPTDNNGSAVSFSAESSSSAPAPEPAAELAEPYAEPDPAESAGYRFGLDPAPALQAVAPPPVAPPMVADLDKVIEQPVMQRVQEETTPKQAAAPIADSSIQVQAVEVLNNIDQAMGACAMNLSALQKIATEQTETLRSLAESMQNQSMFEMGLNLNNLMETLSAAVEPMKAVGELVPAIDSLVTTLETKEANKALQPKESRPTPDSLVMSLADQLSAGAIDPWTFKHAYMAVFRDEHPADLLRRLVDLLGTQRLSGELFRQAYDAVQASDPPKEGEKERTIVQVVQDENLVRELEELKKHQAEMTRQKDELSKQMEELSKHNEELSKRPAEQVVTLDSSKLDEMGKFIEELQKRQDAREAEFQTLLSGKDQELQEAQELLNSRWEEFNARYDELTETLHKRDEMIAEKEAEISRKDSENQQLKVQMEELRDSTKEMHTEMQKQLAAAAAKPKEEPRSGPGFFDPSPAGAAPAANQAQPLFDPNPARQPLFQPAAQQAQPAPQQVAQPAPAAMAPPQPAQMVAAQQTAQQAAAAQASSNQAIPRPPQTTAPFLTGGSYGSGVRAQVFEVIVRQALAGAPWKEICAGPMSVNNITPEEVEAEVKRRQALLGKK